MADSRGSRLEMQPGPVRGVGGVVPATDLAAGMSVAIARLAAAAGRPVTRGEIATALTASGWTPQESALIVRAVVGRLLAAELAVETQGGLLLTPRGAHLAPTIIDLGGELPPLGPVAGRPAPAPGQATPSGPVPPAAPAANPVEAAASQSLSLVRATGAGPSGALPLGVLSVTRPVGLPTRVVMLQAGVEARGPLAGPGIVRLTLSPLPAHVGAHAVADVLGAAPPAASPLPAARSDAPAPAPPLPPTSAGPETAVGAAPDATEGAPPPPAGPALDVEDPRVQELLLRADAVGRTLTRAGVRPLPLILHEDAAALGLLYALRGGAARVLVDVRAVAPPGPATDPIAASLAATSAAPTQRRRGRRRRWPGEPADANGLFRLLFGTPLGAVLAEQGVDVVLVDEDGAVEVEVGGPVWHDVDPDEVVLAFLEDEEGSWPIW